MYDESNKDECIINLPGPERDYWLGSETGMLGCYWFSEVVFAGIAWTGNVDPTPKFLHSQENQ